MSGDALQSTIARCVGQLAMLKYFPADEFARAGIMQLLMSMAETPEQVSWLTRKILEMCDEWPGPVTIRGIFCSKFKPKDGIDVDPPPRIAALNEMRAIEASENHKRLAGPASALLGEAERSLATDPRREAQNRRWYAICTANPSVNVPRLFRKLATEFAVTESLDRRDFILDEVSIKASAHK